MKTWLDLRRLGALFTAIAWLYACSDRQNADTPAQDAGGENVHTPVQDAGGENVDAPAQDAGGGNDHTPAATALGSPLGDPTTATIGAAGGTLRSADDRLTLRVPPGALATDTELGIQPITNLAHGGVGDAYRLTPDGQTFAVPVTLTFAYDDAALGGTEPSVLGVAFQDADRYWSWLSSPALDAAAHTLSVVTTHFTDFSLVHGVQLKPASADVAVGDAQSLRLSVCYAPAVGEDELQPLGYACEDAVDDLAPPALVREWAVNGVSGGASATGTVVAAPGGATYTAPGVVPSPDTVAVSARLDYGTRGTVLVVANLRITRDAPGYIGTVDFSSPTNGITEGTATVTWTLHSANSDNNVFVGSGSMTYVFTVTDCTPVTVTAPLRFAQGTESCSQWSCLTVRDDTADVPRSYDFILAHEETAVDIHCREGTSGAYTISGYTPAALAMATYCPPAGYLTYTGSGATLAGSYACDGSNIISSWSFTRQ